MTPERLAHLVATVDRWERAERLCGGSGGSLTLAARGLVGELMRVRALADGWLRSAATLESTEIPSLGSRADELRKCAREVLGE